MITAGFYPLVLGFIATSILIAYSDLKYGWMHSWQWIPGVLGVGIFYGLALANGGLYLFVTALITSGLMLLATWGTLKFFHRRNEESAIVGIGDYITVAMFAFWPEMVVPVAMLALVTGIVGFRLNFWNRGLRGIPLAGLMGVFCIIHIILVAIF